ncbi:MAG: hypothetical protein DME19_01305 [Verrucomicrobia bacterium]|nr:MAG: hypothetical protein DME19_01305 [Verrucomicrobiota bacterium]
MNRWFGPGLFLLVGLALALRLPQLDRRPMHNDEGVNAIRFRSLWVNHAYRYDPNEFHGPTLEYFTVPSAWVSGSKDFNQFTETTFRRVTVSFGVGLILLLYLLADGLGKVETLWAAAFTAISPAMVFYSRYYIHEMLLVFFTALTLGACWRYVQGKSTGWCLLAGLGLGLMFASKETFIFAALSMVMAVACAAAWSRWLDGESLAVKSYLNVKHVSAALTVLLLVWMILFSSFFTHFGGLIDSLKTFWIWAHRAAGDSPHVHPWYFYFRRLLFFHHKNGPVWSEALIVALAMVGCVAAFTRRWLGQTNLLLVRTMAFFTGGLMLIYTVLSYKTPWCLLGFLHGMILLAGVGAAVLLRARRTRWLKWTSGILLVVATLRLGWLTYPYSLSSREHYYFYGILLIVGGGIVTLLLSRTARQFNWTTGALLMVASAQLGWQACRASFPYCASPGNPYVYAQTSPDILKLVDKIEALARVSPDGHDLVVKVMSDHDSYWPLPWYLRRFTRVGYWNNIPPDPLAPIMIVSSEFQAAFDDRPEKSHLMAGYFQLRPQVFFELYVEVNLWREYVKSLPPEKD